MSPKKVSNATVSRGTDVERRFASLLSVIKERYLAAGYELDDVHLAEILGVHDGVLRKGKSSSVSPALVNAVGKIWKVDLNWLLLGKGEKPMVSSEPWGIERLSLDIRIARGRWDERKVRRLLAEKNLTQRELADLLDTNPQQAGNLVRGILRTPELRKRLAGILKVTPDSLFLVSRSLHERTALRSLGSSARGGKLFSAETVRRALENLISERLDEALASYSVRAGSSGFEPSEVRIFVPPVPEGLSASERKRYEHNREVLERWSRTSGAFEIPSEVAERYCREVVGFYDGGRVNDVGGVLRDFLQEQLERSDTKQSADAERIKVKKNVLLIGDTEIEIDDPELLAKIPEYFGSKLGRKRLLDWLRKNVKSK
jgi:transcriptional regulator with XRE-family HTH domain